MLLSFLVPPSGAAPAPALGPVLLSNALTAAVLVWIGGHLRARGLSRALVLWAVWGGIQAASWMETLLFDLGIPRSHLPWLVLYTLAYSAGLSLVVALLPAAATADDARTDASTPAWWRVAACDGLYIGLYFAAGTLAWPYLRAFYEARPMPGTAAVVAMQVVRGLWFAAIVFLIVRQVRTSRGRAALAAALAFGILGGVAPLLIPNPYLPDAVRWAHLPETGVSNFLFGLAAGWLLSPPAAERSAAAAVAGASV
jgi:hypothetical protein